MHGLCTDHANQLLRILKIIISWKNISMRENLNRLLRLGKNSKVQLPRGNRVPFDDGTFAPRAYSRETRQL